MKYVIKKKLYITNINHIIKNLIFATFQQPYPSASFFIGCCCKRSKPQQIVQLTTP